MPLTRRCGPNRSASIRARTVTGKRSTRSRSARTLPQPAAVAVFSPWADISRSGVSMRSKDGADPLFSYDAMGWYAGRYMPDGDRSAPLASPVFATLAGLPPLLIQVGSHEVLLDDAVRLAANAGRDDVDVTLQIAPEGTHVFQLHFEALDEADEAIDEVARFFTRHAGWAGR